MSSPIGCLRRIPARALVHGLRMCPLETGWIDEHLCAVNLGFVNIFLYQKGGAQVCFDAGYGNLTLRQELTSLNTDPADVSHIFLTHSDFDHVGCLNMFSGAQVYLSEDEEKLIAPPRPLRFLVVRNRRIRRKYKLLCDNETVSVGPITVKAIKTPGHTPGSMSYLVDGRVLFTGDTLSLRSGQTVPNKMFTMDLETLRTSADALTKLKGVEMLVTAHDGILRLRAN